jgi:hypothetical protein
MAGTYCPATSAGSSQRSINISINFSVTFFTLQCTPGGGSGGVESGGIAGRSGLPRVHPSSADPAPMVQWVQRTTYLRMSLTADVFAACGPPVAIVLLMSSEYILHSTPQRAQLSAVSRN